MKIQMWTIGKSHDSAFGDTIENYTTRIQKYFPVKWNILTSPKNLANAPELVVRQKEAELVLTVLSKNDFLVVLDEHGKQLTSIQLAQFIQMRLNATDKNLIFLIGGAYGVDASVLDRADYKWSLSTLTFPHQLVRLLLAEQIYRACTIVRNEKYHHS